MDLNFALKPTSKAVDAGHYSFFGSSFFLTQFYR
jgi:hypothetical protein